MNIPPPPEKKDNVALGDGQWQMPFCTQLILREGGWLDYDLYAMTPQGQRVLQAEPAGSFFSDERAICDGSSGAEAFRICRKSWKMSATFLIKRGDQVMLTLRKTIFGDSACDICVYEGEETFTYSNQPKSGRPHIFTFRGFYVGWTDRRQLQCSTYPNEEVVAWTQQIDQGWTDFIGLDFEDKYCVQIAPGYDVALMVGCFMTMHDLLEENEDDYDDW
eukprot:TRINITY_DN15424_c0_g1_i2.p2 TRINITY_DN15424_c0_g1~~TRINITY_DN15424_c0_g1_i2.p2  ORF type:complete len:219 (-),score=49.76 TRINITY_DN15424_c0_g1_i2:160-816(-)